MNLGDLLRTWRKRALITAAFAAFAGSEQVVSQPVYSSRAHSAPVAEATQHVDRTQYDSVVVAPGNTLGTIVADYALSHDIPYRTEAERVAAVNAVWRLNQYLGVLTDPNLLRVGETIYLTAPEAATPQVSAARRSTPTSQTSNPSFSDVVATSSSSSENTYAASVSSGGSTHTEPRVTSARALSEPVPSPQAAIDRTSSVVAGSSSSTMEGEGFADVVGGASSAAPVEGFLFTGLQSDSSTLVEPPIQDPKWLAYLAAAGILVAAGGTVYRRRQSTAAMDTSVADYVRSVQQTVASSSSPSSHTTRASYARPPSAPSPASSIDRTPVNTPDAGTNQPPKPQASAQSQQSLAGAVVAEASASIRGVPGSSPYAPPAGTRSSSETRVAAVDAKHLSAIKQSAPSVFAGARAGRKAHYYTGASTASRPRELGYSDFTRTGELSPIIMPVRTMSEQVEAASDLGYVARASAVCATMYDSFKDAVRDATPYLRAAPTRAAVALTVATGLGLGGALAVRTNRSVTPSTIEQMTFDSLRDRASVELAIPQSSEDPSQSPYAPSQAPLIPGTPSLPGQLSTAQQAAYVSTDAQAPVSALAEPLVTMSRESFSAIWQQKQAESKQWSKSDRADFIQDRRELLKQMYQSGVSAADARSVFGISASTYYADTASVRNTHAGAAARIR